MKKLVALAGLILALQPVAASAACLQPTEVDALIRFSMPNVINAVADKCTPTLKAGAYLITSRAALNQRYAGPSKAAFPAARLAFGKMTEKADLASLKEDTLHDLIGLGIGGVFAKLKPEDCDKADRLLAIFDPLPAVNMAQLIGFMLEMSTKKDDAGANNAPIKVCPRG